VTAGSTKRQAGGPGRIARSRHVLAGLAIAAFALLALAPLASAAAPVVLPGVASGLSDSGASLNARLDPQGEVTTYHFEYGLEDCESDPCTTLPGAKTGGSGPRLVTRTLDGLQPSTTYHFRLIATNGTGTTEGPDRSFVTFAPGAKLPDNRVYEMVSPPDKNGGNVEPLQGVMASPDGDSVVFASLSAFADAASSPVLGPYYAKREGASWVTHGIAPPLPADFTFSNVARLLAVSSDLTSSVIAAHPAPPQAPGEQYFALDFFRRDLPDGNFLNLTPVVPEPFTFGVGSDETQFPGADDSLDTIGINAPQQLAAGGTEGSGSAYIWSADDEALHYVAYFPDGTPSAVISSIGNFRCCEENKNAISADGSQVVFRTRHPGEESDVFLRQNPSRPQSAVVGGECTEPAMACTIEASASQRTTPDPGGDKEADFQGASAQGDKVLFRTSEQLLDSDTDTSQDMYLFEPGSETLRRISVDQNPSDGTGAAVVEVLDAGEDVDHVYFAARNLLVPGQPTGPGMKIYAWRDGTADGSLSYVTTLDAPLDRDTWGGEVAGNPLGTTPPKRPRVQASPNGRYLVFSAMTTLGAYDNVKPGGCGVEHRAEEEPQVDSEARCAELYRYDSQTQQTTCLSCDPSGEPATGDAAMYTPHSLFIGMGDSDGTGFVSRNVLDDGRVLFETEDSLTPSDANAASDVYEWEEGRVSLLSSGASGSESFFANASPSGDDVFIYTRDRLVGWDVDGNVDLYDARVGGGLPEPPAAGQSCAGDACQPPPSLPDDPTPSSASFSGPGNVNQRQPRPARCAKGKHKQLRAKKGKSRCAKAKKHDRSNRNWRASR